MVLVCVAALVGGRWEERLLGGVYLAACMATLAVEQRPWTGPQGAVIAIDAMVLAVAVGVVLRSGKPWPIIAAAFQLLTLGAHLAFVAGEGRLSAAGYLTALALWSYGTVACIAWGVGADLSPARLLTFWALRDDQGSQVAATASTGSIKGQPVEREGAGPGP